MVYGIKYCTGHIYSNEHPTKKSFSIERFNKKDNIDMCVVPKDYINMPSIITIEEAEEEIKMEGFFDFEYYREKYNLP